MESESTPFPLKDVLGAILVAMSEAQHISDLYTDTLRSEYRSSKNDLNLLRLPNTQLERAEVTLPFAIASVELPATGKGSSKKTPPEPPGISVLVTAADLETIKPDSITTIRFRIGVDDAEVIDLPQNPP